MANVNCGCKFNCTGLAVITSLIIGIVGAFLTITAVITLAPLFLGIVIGIALIFLIALLLTVGSGNCISRRCETALDALLVGIIGTVVTAALLLAVTFAATSVIGAIVVGLLLFFVSLIITESACLARCLAECND